RSAVWRGGRHPVAGHRAHAGARRRDCVRRAPLARLFAANSRARRCGGDTRRIALELVPVGYFQLNIGFLVVLLVVRLLSGAILSGLLAKVIGDALARTGVLSNFALGRARQEAV